MQNKLFHANREDKNSTSCLTRNVLLCPTPNLWSNLSYTYVLSLSLSLSLSHKCQNLPTPTPTCAGFSLLKKMTEQDQGIYPSTYYLEWEVFLILTRLVISYMCHISRLNLYKHTPFVIHFFRIQLISLSFFSYTTYFILICNK